MKKALLMKTANWLVVIGALNWGLTVFNFNLVTWLSGLVKMPMLTTVVYALVGISAIAVGLKLLKK